MSNLLSKFGQIGPKWDKSGTYYMISFSTFWLGEPKCTETDLKKSQICPIWGQSDQIWKSNLTYLIPAGSRFLSEMPDWLEMAPKIHKLVNIRFSILSSVSLKNMIFKNIPQFVYFCASLNHVEIWSEKAPDLSHLGLIWPTVPNLGLFKAAHCAAVGGFLSDVTGIPLVGGNQMSGIAMCAESCPENQSC